MNFRPPTTLRALLLLTFMVSVQVNATADDAGDPLTEQIPYGFTYKSFDEAVQQIESKTHFKVSCQDDLKTFMESMWINLTVYNEEPKEVTVKTCLDMICDNLALRWHLEPTTKIVTLSLKWKITDPRVPAELLKAVWQPGYGTDYEKDEKWQTAFNALLSNAVNFDKAWKVRQKSCLYNMMLFPYEASKPILMKPMIDTAGRKYIVIVICQPIHSYPGHGTISYYWFQEDGLLAGADLMDSGWRCEVVDTTVDNEYGARSNQASELHMILKRNMREFILARLVLGSNGLELIHLVNMYGDKMNNDGVDIGKSVMSPDKH